jgi:LacI family transcriptional regulator
MRDVAALAGVSLSTVSRVINAEPTVAEEFVSRVRRAATQLNYQHNLAASELRRRVGPPSTIGLLIQDVSNQFSASIFRSVEDYAHKNRVSVLASNVDEDPDRERQLVATLVSRRVNGLIIVPAGQDQSYLQTEQRSGTPIVFLDRPPCLLAADHVLSDNLDGSLKGVLHLVRHGHRRIGYLGELSTYLPANLRHAGYVEALRRSRIRLDVTIVKRELRSEEDARAACLEILGVADSPTALFAAHNRLTVGAIQALRSLGLEKRTAIVGFDDFELADMLQPAVSVVAQDPVEIGRLGAEILFRRMSGDDSPVREHVVATRFIMRGSGEIRRDCGLSGTVPRTAKPKRTPTS